MAESNLIGQDIVSRDLVAKITGRAKYAEDYRAEGMLFTKLLLSPLPHARVVSIDLSAALAHPGVIAILTADEVPQDEFPFEPCLTNEPRYEGEPILAVAAVDEMTAADAIELIRIEFEPLPFAIDPLDSLRPGGPNATLMGNAYLGREVGEVKWEQSVFDAAGPDGMPMGPTEDEWEFGEGGVEAGFAKADVIVEEVIYSHSATHHPLESRTAMSYWQNGKLYIHCSVQSVAQSRRAIADRLGMPFEDVVFVSEFCGGGFGSKIRGSVTEIIPSLLSKKAGGRPVMMRVTRNEETAFGRARPGMQGWVKMGFRRDGRMTAMDLYLVQDTGSYARQGDTSTAADCASLIYTPETMRFRTVTVLTNTPPRAAQRGPGGAQGVPMLEPVVDRAARQLGMDRLEIRRVNGPTAATRFGRGNTQLTSCYAPEALSRGAEMFNWSERSARSGQRNGSKVTGVGLAFSTYYGGTSGWDGLLVIRPDGKLYIHQGVGNLGTHAVMDTARAAADVLGSDWEDCEVVWGSSSLHLPHSSTSSGSQTTHAHTRANHAVGMAMYGLLQELASLELGGSPSSYAVGNGRVYRIGSPGSGLTFAQAAQRAITRGGKFSGAVLPDDINEMTRNSATALAGQGLIAAAKDTYPHTARTYSFVATFAEVEVDVETGMHRVVEVTTVADCGTVVHPRSLAAQANAGVIQGMGFARSHKWSIDPTWGVHLTKRLEAAKPPTILDGPTQYHFAAVDLPDPQNPVGAKGIGEPPVGAGSGALLCAIEDALGGLYGSHTPMSPDKVLSIYENEGRVASGRLAIHV
ncbi:MAG: xanthine dehydrogenase family protein molybdopterin-binding subunit [Gemmatimonadota bacterium]|jgi:CO/xanthine dehydrogenase Mo-binding subunit|nr:xanthine dehydrogenase family protein molybdopterin-binding subunit [Gemmatimonadota bacterium]